MEDSSDCHIGCDGESLAMIPNQKTVNIDCPSSSDVKEGCESPFSSWDSEPEKDISPEVSLQDINIKGNHFVGMENIDDGFSWENQIDYEQKKLLGEEISMLKIQNLKSENQLDNVPKELELNEQNKNTNLMEQLEAVNMKLKISTNEIAILQKELDSKSSTALGLQSQIREEKEKEKEKMAILKSELETLVRKIEENDINHKEELRKMTSILFDFHFKFSWEKEELNSDIASLSKQKKQLTSKLEYIESRNKILEEKVKQYKAEKQKQDKLHSRQLMYLKDEISYLKKKRIDERMNDVEASNLESEKVMIKIDETDVKIDEVEAEIYSYDELTSHLKVHMDMTEYIDWLDEEIKSKLKVEELEKEVTQQNGVIMDMVEEKKKEIRQLCNSLELYRSGYIELILALNGL